MYKTSYYLIEIPILFKNQALHLIFSTRSAVFRVVSNDLWKMVQRREFNSIDKIVLEDLIKSNFIIEEKQDEIATILSENLSSIEDSRVLYMVIQPTANCPLGCHYCGQSHTAKLLTEENQAATLNRIKKKIETKKFDQIRISWFGAEPTSGMKVIESMTPRLKFLAKQYNCSYSAQIVTNGLLLTEGMILKLLDFSVEKFEITLDGTKDFHDQRRHLKNGHPTFERIFSNLLRLCELAQPKIQISVRCNVDGRNRAGIDPLIEEIANAGLSKRVTIYFAPLHSWGNDAHLLSAEKAEFSDWQINWAMKVKELGFKINMLPGRAKSVCMAVNPNSELIDPSGEVFNCTEVSLVPFYETAGKNRHSLGSVQEPVLSHAQRRSVFGDFYKREKIDQIPCGTCRMLPTCGGACPKEWSEGRIPCPPTKYNIEDRLLLHFYWNLEKFGFQSELGVLETLENQPVFS